MTTIVNRDPEALAVYNLLNDNLPIPVGDNVRPGVNGKLNDPPFAVIYCGLQVPDGPISDLGADAASDYVVFSVGGTATQAREVSARVRALLLNSELSITGRRLMQPVQWLPSGEVDRDDDVLPPLFQVRDIFTIHTTPSLDGS